MFKSLFIGIWACVIFAGSSWFFIGQTTNEKASPKKQASYFGGLDYVKLDPLTVTIIRNNEIRGYIIVDAVFTVKQSIQLQSSVPLKYILQDSIIESLHGNSSIDVFRLKKFDLSNFQKLLVTNINTKLGRKAIYEILIQKLDFISKEDIRDLHMRRS